MCPGAPSLPTIADIASIAGELRGFSAEVHLRLNKAANKLGIGSYLPLELNGVSTKEAVEQSLIQETFGKLQDALSTVSAIYNYVQDLERQLPNQK